MWDGINFYCDLVDVIVLLLLMDEVFWMGGLVVEGILVCGIGEIVSFEVSDGVEVVLVIYIGILLDLFGEN